jgi:D-arabinitol 2-dehydrogenase
VVDANLPTGGGAGLGLCMAEGLVEAGGRVHCLDRLQEAPKAFQEARSRMESTNSAGLEYHTVDVSQEEAIRKCIHDIAAERQRLDGLIAGKSMTISNGCHRLTHVLYSCRNPTSHSRP